MTLLVDAAASAVVDGERRWPLRLDCRTGGAVVTVGDRDIAVAPLRWRHKQRLARWAHLGPEFVTSQRAALAVDAAEELGDDAALVVAAVAEFLDGATLPLSPDLLAEVTIEACRATGLAPGAFDDRDASDVELIWRVGSGTPSAAPVPTIARAAGATADPWSDATSIVFVDEPPISVGRPAAEADAAVETDAIAAQADRPDALGVAVPDPGVAGVPPSYDDPAAVESPPALSRPPRPRRDAPRYRVAPAVTPLERPVRHAAATTPAIADRDAPPAGPAGVTQRADAPGAPLPSRSKPAAAPAAIEIGDATGPLIPPAGPLATIAGHQPGPWADQPVGRAFPSRPDPANATDDDRLDELVDAVAARLADQLAMASDDLGIEV